MTDTTTQAAPGIVQEAVTEIKTIAISVENVIHTAVVKVEAGWTWVDGEFVHLKVQAQAAYAWVQKEDPQLAAYIHQLFLNWEQDAENAAQAAGGALGSIIPKAGDAIGTNVDNFIQDLLGASGSALTAKAAVALLVSQGEGVLLSLVKTALAKSIGVLIAAA